MLICAIPGVPVIHAGQEIGSTVHPDASGGTKVLVDWSAADHDLQAFYKSVVRARATNHALESGEITNVWKSGDKALAFLRSTRGNRVLIALNFAARPARFTASVHATGPSTVRDQLSNTLATHSAADLGALELNLEP